MIRTAALLVVIALLVVAAAAMAGQPGDATFHWLGWEVRTTAAAVVLLVILGALLWALVWRAVLWIAEGPRRAARERLEMRRRQGAETLTRGFLAAAAGDGMEARRLANKAAALVDEAPALVRILAAQAAETAGDPIAAQAAYSAMLGFPDMRLAGLRGLMQVAQSQGDTEAALRHAEAAFALARTTRWAWRALLEAKLEAGDWAAALALVDTAQERKIVPPIGADRARAALLAASAAGLADQPEPKARAQATEFALQSARLKPDFAPAVAIAARLLAEDGKTGKASALIEQAWRTTPHPALWLVYRDLDTAETPVARARRLRALAALNPEHHESRVVMVEQALMQRDGVAAESLASLLDQGQPPARDCALLARVAHQRGRPDEARAWVARAGAAPVDADWSDIDAEGRAFAYTPIDWARLVTAYAESGELIHPRLERREKVITELPQLPGGYVASRPYLEAASKDAALPIPDDPGLLEPPPNADPAAEAIRNRPARRPAKPRA